MALHSFGAAASPLVFTGLRGIQGSGRSLAMEKETEEKEAGGKIRSADPAFCLPAVPTPLYW